jgi:hypothetical protein
MDAESAPVKPSTVSRRMAVVTGFCRTCVIDTVLEHSPADYVRRPRLPNESPVLGYRTCSSKPCSTPAYIRGSLNARLSGHLQWEGWQDRELAPHVARKRWFSATGWNALHPTRLAFQGVAFLALVGVLAAGIFLWITQSPSWYVIIGFTLGWLIDALATIFLHRAFDRAG